MAEMNGGASRSTPTMEMLADATDADLVRSGDIASLVRRHYGPVFGLARRLLGGEADARDAAQETFARAIGNLRSYDARRSFRTWIFSIAANYIRDLLRRRRQLSLDAAGEDELPDL